MGAVVYVLMLSSILYNIAVQGYTNLAFRKPTFTSSVAAGGIPARAVDGNTDPNYFHGSCTHTHNQMMPYWIVDLGARYYIQTVKITNRADCCGNRLRDFDISVGEGGPYRIIGYVERVGSGATITEHFGSPAPIGRYLQLQMRSIGMLTLCEVQVFGWSANLALRKHAHQSSLDFGGSPARAVDGNRNTIYNAGSCTHSHLNEVRPFWEVDLGSKFYIRAVAITNRGDCCANRLKDFDITVRDGQTERHIAYVAHDVASGKTMTVFSGCRLQAGRHLQVKMRHRGTLTLCEVQVYGAVPIHRNLALNKLTYQSSTAHGGLPGRAVDGNRSPNWGHNSCTHTHQQPRPKWIVDLGRSYNIHEVRITNRADCCSNRLINFDIKLARVDPEKDTSYRVIGSRVTALPSGMTSLPVCRTFGGRYLMIQLRYTGILTLCEVEVFGSA